MTTPPVSVIVVSRHRAAALMRCIVALTQQDHPNFELIVVADPEAIGQAETLPLPLKCVRFDQANISAARNAGLAMAAAPVVAFIDDDAVAEPTWLSRLTVPFADPDVTASTGFIRGRNGISYQWQACEVDQFCQDHLLMITEPTLRPATPKRAVKTQGTNCAFRRDALLAIGGFDPAYRFYLDEADVNLRLPGLTAIIPDAQVHHGYLASNRRAANRVPLSLHDIAASTAIFLRRHAPEADPAEALKALSLRESTRIAAHRRAGRIDAVAELALLTSLTQGWAEGLVHPLTALPPLPPATAPLQPLGTGPRPGKILAGRFWQKRRLLAEAAASTTTITTVFLFSPTARPHKLSFQSEGYWLQIGGIFGQSTRQGPRVRLVSFRKRIAEETARLARYRPTD
ncbi:glycosyltransferase family 2 protein [Cypionkella sp.]|uniref:glycosyltransferase family 2 protein n=1 Tax=Cypionkella sp. TaxID=2811411 RepID=UPI002ABB3031|nr:glycosyltransferase [Cypionkella sp.]MDZ4391767.1 glycosyltransferase [Cypionkella sp.]